MNENLQVELINAVNRLTLIVGFAKSLMTRNGQFITCPGNTRM